LGTTTPPEEDVVVKRPSFGFGNQERESSGRIRVRCEEIKAGGWQQFPIVKLNAVPCAVFNQRWRVGAESIEAEKAS